MATGGLRERSKTRRREAIQRTAYALFAERGYAATTIADIAEAAEVAPRTVTLYFPSKQDLALSTWQDFADRLAAALREREPAESALDALERWLRAEREQRTGLDDLSDRMLDLNPDLKAICQARLAEVIAEGARMIADEQGRSPGDLGPRIVAAAVAAVLSQIGHQPAESDIETAMAFLRAGAATLQPPAPDGDLGTSQGAQQGT
jgi:AcrR family transcriptional regulator